MAVFQFLCSSLRCPYNWNKTEIKQKQTVLFQPKQNAKTNAKTINIIYIKQFGRSR